MKAFQPTTKVRRSALSLLFLIFGQAHGQTVTTTSTFTTTVVETVGEDQIVTVEGCPPLNGLEICDQLVFSPNSTTSASSSTLEFTSESTSAPFILRGSGDLVDFRIVWNDDATVYLSRKTGTDAAYMIINPAANLVNAQNPEEILLLRFNETLSQTKNPRAKARQARSDETFRSEIYNVRHGDIPGVQTRDLTNEFYFGDSNRVRNEVTSRGKRQATGPESGGQLHLFNNDCIHSLYTSVIDADSRDLFMACIKGGAQVPAGLQALTLVAQIVSTVPPLPSSTSSDQGQSSVPDSGGDDNGSSTFPTSSPSGVSSSSIAITGSASSSLAVTSASATGSNTPISPGELSASAESSISNSLTVRSESLTPSGTGTSHTISSPSTSQSHSSSPSSTASVTTRSRFPPGPPIYLATPTPLYGDAEYGVAEDSDDVFSGITVPFALQIYGQQSSQIYLSTNGILSLDIGTAYSTSRVLPSRLISPLSICLFWDDLYVSNNTQQGVYYQINGTAPSRILYVQYYLTRYSDRSQLYNFIVTYEEAVPKVMTVNYIQVPDRGINATVGLQSLNENLYYQWSYRSANVSSGLILRFDSNANNIANISPVYASAVSSASTSSSSSFGSFSSSASSSIITQNSSISSHSALSMSSSSSSSSLTSISSFSSLTIPDSSSTSSSTSGFTSTSTSISSTSTISSVDTTSTSSASPSPTSPLVLDGSVRAFTAGQDQDDSVAEIDIPFNISLYDVSVNKIYACINGFISWDSSSAYQNNQLPTSALTDTALAIFWDDMFARGVRPDQGIFYKISGTNGSRLAQFEFRIVRARDISRVIHFVATWQENVPNVAMVTYYQNQIGGSYGVVGMQYVPTSASATWSYRNSSAVYAGLTLKFDSNPGVNNITQV